MRVKELVGTFLILGLIALHLVVPFIVWRRTAQSESVERAATIRAAFFTLLLVPTLVPGVHGVFPLPTWMAVVGFIVGKLDHDPSMAYINGYAMAYLTIPPAVGFFALRAFFLYRLRNR